MEQQSENTERQTHLLIALASGLIAALIAVAAAEFTGMALGDANDAAVTAAIVAERGCISQYGPGERYAKRRVPQCAPMVEAPNHILAMPVSP